MFEDTRELGRVPRVRTVPEPEKPVKVFEDTGELGRMPRVRSVPELEAIRSAVEAKGEASMVLRTDGADGDFCSTADVEASAVVTELVSLKVLVEGAVEDILSGARSGAAGEISQGGYGGPREKGGYGGPRERGR